VTAVDAACAPIVCRALTRHYGDTVGIDELDLTIEAGSVTGFLGPNGAGKTTVIRMLVGLLRPTAGHAELFGIDVAEPRARQSLGFMPADPAFYRHLSAQENLDLLAELGGWDCPDRAWAADLLELRDADLRRPVAEFSSGMVQKLGLVQAVQHHPNLVVLDEPANRLDPIAHRRFEEMMTAIAQSGRTVFLSSHTLSEVEAVCDRVAMVRAGRLLTVAHVDALRETATRNVTIHYSSEPPPAPEQLVDVRVDGTIVHGKLRGASVDALRSVLAAPDVVDVLVEPASLEDTFLHLYEDDGS